MSDDNSTDYSDEDQMVVTASHLIEDYGTTFVGIGLPMRAALLAQRLYNPELVMVFEGGSIGPEISTDYFPSSTNSMRVSRQALMLPPITDTFAFLQKGYIDGAMVGCAQIDKHGNINTSAIGEFDNPKVRLTGGGGAGDLTALAEELTVVTKHEKQRFVEEVDFITSPGYLSGGSAREESGLPSVETIRVVTDLGLLGFDPETKEMRIEGVHSHSSVVEIQENTGFDIGVADDVESIDPPSTEERTFLDGIESAR
ncbi:CoA-transferase subunit beta [Natrinema gelatinilyticum]|uniref:CoA-transferase subunit beta n=1 Tax=Natrinema gelatinilyticum TaxID=2961571 RepID=UPI0020C5161D|nr:CoA-transferase [Natrinema gelatinilyticum]